MEQSKNFTAPEPATDEPGSIFNSTADAAGEALISDCLAATFPPEGRKPRHDGWTADAVGTFLHMLAACGVVEQAARAAGLSAAGAYAFRNRRQGRAFARMWDAILIHRTRARLASENQARAIAGCVSIRRRDGVPDSEYHYHDNRLSMAMLTRLDRLAERESPNDDHLRALSEDMEAFIDCAAEGGDLDAFVEARQLPVAPEPMPELPEADVEDEIAVFARLARCADYRNVAPGEIEVDDLDPSQRADWGSDQWVRAFRSGFLAWLDAQGEDADRLPGPAALLRFTCLRAAAAAAVALASTDPANPMEMQRQGRADEIDVDDLDPADFDDWTDEQRARAWCSGLLTDMAAELWKELAVEMGVGGEED